MLLSQTIILTHPFVVVVKTNQNTLTETYNEQAFMSLMELFYYYYYYYHF